MHFALVQSHHAGGTVSNPDLCGAHIVIANLRPNRRGSSQSMDRGISPEGWRQMWCGIARVESLLCRRKMAPAPSVALVGESDFASTATGSVPNKIILPIKTCFLDTNHITQLNTRST
jgi:hypothetical protein